MEIYIKRKIVEDLKKHLKKKEISFIIGPRQAEKTTVMKILEKELREKVKINGTEIFILPFYESLNFRL